MVGLVGLKPTIELLYFNFAVVCFIHVPPCFPLRCSVRFLCFGPFSLLFLLPSLFLTLPNIHNHKDQKPGENKRKTTTKQTTAKQATTTTPKHQQRKNNNGQTKTRPTKKKNHQIASKLLTAQNRAENCAHPSQNAIKLQKQAFQKIRTQNFAKCRKKAIFMHTNIFRLVHLQDPWHNVTSKNPIFIRATPCRTGIALN